MSCCGGKEEEEQLPAPIRIRGCTDVFWLCIFILFWFLMILIAAFALVYGNPKRLVNGYDSFGNVCGSKQNQKFGNMELSGLDTSDKPFLFYMDVMDIKNSLKICVKKCPDRKLASVADICEFYEDTGSQLCHDKPNSNFSACYLDREFMAKSKYCPELPVNKSIPKLNRCIPQSLKDAGETIVANLYGIINSWELIEQILGDLYKTWREILALSFLAFVLSLCMIAVFHLMAAIVTWLVIVLVSCACIIGTALLWWTYAGIKKSLDSTNPNELLEESARNEEAFRILAIVATVITIILLLLMCFLRSKISFMTALFKESAKCLAQLPGLFFTPLVTFIALLIFYAFWVTVILSLATANYADTKSIQLYGTGLYYPRNLTPQAIEEMKIATKNFLENETNPQSRKLNISFDDFKSFTLVEYVDPTWVKYMWWVYIFGLIWISEFIAACQTMVIAGAVAHWYFRGKNASISPVCSSFGKLIVYHLGSVACGSLLITIFKLPRLVLSYLHAKFERTKETSPCAQCGLKSCICCFYCLENFIRYMNHNAYTVVTIEGTNFCNGAKIAFSTIVSNAVQIAVINGIGDFILFLGKCFVTATTGSVGLLFMRQDPRLHFFAIPVLITCIFAFFIAHCVISLYENVIDTLFLCVCEDKTLNVENGKWKTSPLAQIGMSSSSNGQQTHELSPLNR